jgi:hypothetical protein
VFWNQRDGAPISSDELNFRSNPFNFNIFANAYGIRGAAALN